MQKKYVVQIFSSQKGRTLRQGDRLSHIIMGFLNITCKMLGAMYKIVENCAKSLHPYIMNNVQKCKETLGLLSNREENYYKKFQSHQ